MTGLLGNLVRNAYPTKEAASIVLLPGLDGTGEFFSWLLPHMPNVNVQVISLPQSGPQDYFSLKEFVKSHLPAGEFVLLAESFSGLIAYLLACDKLPQMKGIIFVATFLSTPKPWQVRLAKFVPIRLLINSVLASWGINFFLCNGQWARRDLQSVLKTIRTVPVAIWKERLNAVGMCRFNPKKISSGLPVCYLGAKSDRLVPKTKVQEFERCFDNLEVTFVAGPHFILQTQPQQCAAIIREFFEKIRNSKSF